MDAGERRRDNAEFAEFAEDAESAEKRKAPASESGCYKTSDKCKNTENG
jgi:hypothetical protein